MSSRERRWCASSVARSTRRSAMPTQPAWTPPPSTSTASSPSRRNSTAYAPWRTCRTNLFLLCVSNFSCTIDAFTHVMLASELGSKPYLILEIDAHTADAGVQTRLEAFLDIVANYQE